MGNEVLVGLEFFSDKNYCLCLQMARVWGYSADQSCCISASGRKLELTLRGHIHLSIKDSPPESWLKMAMRMLGWTQHRSITVFSIQALSMLKGSSGPTSIDELLPLQKFVPSRKNNCDYHQNSFARWHHTERNRQKRFRSSRNRTTHTLRIKVLLLFSFWSCIRSVW